LLFSQFMKLLFSTIVIPWFLSSSFATRRIASNQSKMIASRQFEDNYIT
jgi:hypothetical protein